MMRLRLPLIPFLSALLAVVPAGASELTPLISLEEPESGWSFNNGREFGGGAAGSLEFDPAAVRDGLPTLRLDGDFTKAGKYVEAGRRLEDGDFSAISMWLKNPDADRLTLRLNDSSGQTHQFALRTERSADWGRLVFPVEEFFERIGRSDAVPGVEKYDHWGGANDGRWHGPATAIYLLLSDVGGVKRRSIWLNDIALVRKPPVVAVPAMVDLGSSAADWWFSDGREFPGAKGALEDEGETMRLAGDFTGGGAYVAAIRDLSKLGLDELGAIRLQYRTETAAELGVQMVDATGQTHQRRVPVRPDGGWNDLELVPESIAGGERWGGANDGKWHHPGKLIAISLTTRSEPEGNRPTILFRNVEARGTRQAVLEGIAFEADFSSGPAWQTQGDVAPDPAAGRPSLRLGRTLENAGQPVTAASPAFPVRPGHWRIDADYRAELHSPDNSYSAVLSLEVMDRSGKRLETFTLAEIFGSHPWTPHAATVELPQQAASARIVARFEKTWGNFWIGRLTAGFLEPSDAVANRVSRILFSTSRLGNLLFPEDNRTVAITVEAGEPLPEEQLALRCVVRDYWGAEQIEPFDLKLVPGPGSDGRHIYQATLDLSHASLEVGRYYEVEATSTQSGARPFSHQTSLAILPEAPAKTFAPSEVPFTSRNWDNRVTEYIRLSDRLGIRVVGLWGGWSSEPPYKPEAPRLDLVKELGLGWLTTTPAKFIEAGKRDYDETALRQGVRNFIREFGDHRPLIINLGNEPHGTGERVKANVEAYRVLYDEIKKTDPTIPVVATSVEPNPEYFELGYGKYCDAYDFHIYESAADVRRTMREYRTLMEKHDVVKPIWSTELGLNSQGQTRQVVAVELLKKTASFFAEGGANMSWFGILYPDPEGKLHGTAGDSHNVFDCRYNRYAPRLDAIAYYNAVNGVGNKRFIGEKIYNDDVHAYLFRNDAKDTLQILWKESGAADLVVPLDGVGEVRLIRIDGTVSRLDAGGDSITLSIGEDPLLLLYQGDAPLPPELLASDHRWGDGPSSVSRSGAGPLSVTLEKGIAATPHLPPFWSMSDDFILAPPSATGAREVPVTIVLERDGRNFGELHRRFRIE